MFGFFPTLIQWRELRAAWRERDANPVRHYFELACQRRRGRLPWWRRDLALRFWVLVGVFAAYSNLSAAFEHAARLPGKTITLLELSLAACSSTLMLLALPALAWLALSIYDVLSSAACLLSQPLRRRLDIQVDSAVLAARYSGPELLLGLMLPLLRRVQWPIAVCSLGAVLTTALLAAYNEPWSLRILALHLGTAAQLSRGNPLAQFSMVVPGSVQTLLLMPLGAGGIWLSGLLASSGLMLLALTAGRGLRMDVQATVLGAIYAVGAVGFLMLTTSLTVPLRWILSGGSPHHRVPPPITGASSILAWILLLLLAVSLPLFLWRSRGTALGVMYGLPLLFVGSIAGMICAQHLHVPGMLHPAIQWSDCLTAWSIFAPMSGFAVPHPICFGVSFGTALALPTWFHFHWLLLILAQLLLLAGLLRCALDSINASRAAESG